MADFYRYLRPKLFDPTSPTGCVVQETGGIGLRIRLDHSRQRLIFACTRCQWSKVFCHKIAKKILDRRFVSNEVITVRLQVQKTPIENIIDELSISPDKKLRALASELNNILRHNDLADAVRFEYGSIFSCNAKNQYA